MYKQNGIPRKPFDIMKLRLCDMKNIIIEINQHPNGKLKLPKMKNEDAIKLLELKGYL